MVACGRWKSVVVGKKKCESESKQAADKPKQRNELMNERCPVARGEAEASPTDEFIYEMTYESEIE